MYERMLNKQEQPDLDAMSAWCGALGGDFAGLNQWVAESFSTERSIVFPYGNSYGWGVSHKLKRRLICNVFPEAGAFSVMLRLTERQFEAVYPRVGEYARDYIDHKYPCSDGGWIHYRVSCPEQLDDIKAMVAEKFVTAKKAKP